MLDELFDGIFTERFFWIKNVDRIKTVKKRKKRFTSMLFWLTLYIWGVSLSGVCFSVRRAQESWPLCSWLRAGNVNVLATYVTEIATVCFILVQRSDYSLNVGLLRLFAVVTNIFVSVKRRTETRTKTKTMHLPLCKFAFHLHVSSSCRRLIRSPSIVKFTTSKTPLSGSFHHVIYCS